MSPRIRAEVLVRIGQPMAQKSEICTGSDRRRCAAGFTLITVLKDTGTPCANRE